MQAALTRENQNERDLKARLKPVMDLGITFNNERKALQAQYCDESIDLPCCGVAHMPK
jgi:hypothetical protein